MPFQVKLPLMPLGKQFSEDLDVLSSAIKKERNKSFQMAVCVCMYRCLSHFIIQLTIYFVARELFRLLLKAFYVDMESGSIIYRLLIANFHINCSDYRTVCDSPRQVIWRLIMFFITSYTQWPIKHKGNPSNDRAMRVKGLSR